MTFSIRGFNLLSLKTRRLVMSVQKIARRLGIEVHRYWPPPQESNILALTISDVLLRKVLAGGAPSEFTFLQIGANDGLTDDPIRRFVLKYGFRGVLVEPQPLAFEALRRHYKAQPGLIFENAAIAPMDGKVTLYRFKLGPGVPRWADCLASFSRDVLLNNLDNVTGEVEEMEVEAVTFSSLLAKHRLRTVDLLQIDTEGFDFDVIRMINFREFSPTIINFEQGLLMPAVRHECYEYLSRVGYRVTENEFDAVAYREPEDQAISGIRVRPE